MNKEGYLEYKENKVLSVFRKRYILITKASVSIYKSKGGRIIEIFYRDDIVVYDNNLPENVFIVFDKKRNRSGSFKANSLSSKKEWMESIKAEHKNTLESVKSEHIIFRYIGEGLHSNIYLKKVTERNKANSYFIVKNYIKRENYNYNEYLESIKLLINNRFVVKIHHFLNDTNQVTLITDYYPNTLSNVLSKGVLPHNISLCICYQILNAFKYLHENNVFYGDFNINNVLISDDNNVILTVPGPIYKYTSTEKDIKKYFSPEYISGGEPCEKNDFWGLGILLYELIAGFTPFWHHQQEQYIELCKTRNPVYSNCFDNVSKSLISSLLDENVSFASLFEKNPTLAEDISRPMLPDFAKYVKPRVYPEDFRPILGEKTVYLYDNK